MIPMAIFWSAQDRTWSSQMWSPASHAPPCRCTRGSHASG